MYSHLSWGFLLSLMPLFSQCAGLQVVQFAPCKRAMELRGLTNSCNMFAQDAMAEVFDLRNLKITPRTAAQKA